MMTQMNWTTRQIVEAADGQLLSGNPTSVFFNIFIDSRAVEKDRLFVAIKGEVHDGHGFIRDVVKKGVSGVVAEKTVAKNLVKQAWWPADAALIAVDDTTLALGRLAAFNRRRAGIKVVGITGSNGKTTTRKLTAGVCATAFNTLSTSGNLNNHIGLPLTLFRLEPAHELAVLEMGMNHPGEIRHLAGIAGPDIGVITNVGPAHLEGLGSIEAIAAAKAELLEQVHPEGTAVINADDPMVLAMADSLDLNVVYYGTGKTADIRACFIEETRKGVGFNLCFPGGDVDVMLNVPGRFMVMNALAAAAAGTILGIDPEKIKKGLESFSPVDGRMNFIQTQKGIHIVNDTYNANPQSMMAAMDSVVKIKGSDRLVLVLGDMLELGPGSESFHRMIGEKAALSGAVLLYATGDFASAVASGAVSKQMKPDQVFTGTKNEIASDLKSRLRPGDHVLVKGSRGMAMEDVVHILEQWANQG